MRRQARPPIIQRDAVKKMYNANPDKQVLIITL